MKSKTADLLYEQMLKTTAQQVGKSTLRLLNTVQTDKVCNQILGLAAALICMLNQYQLSHTDVLGIADNMVYSGLNNNIKPEFKAVQQFMKNEWEL